MANLTVFHWPEVPIVGRPALYQWSFDTGNQGAGLYYETTAADPLQRTPYASRGCGCDSSTLIYYYSDYKVGTPTFKDWPTDEQCTVYGLPIHRPEWMGCHDDMTEEEREKEEFLATMRKFIEIGKKGFSAML